MLIIDMPMPRDCICCPMAHWNKLDEFTGCEVAAGKLFEVTRNKEYAESNYRPDWCPIKGELVRCGECINTYGDNYGADVWCTFNREWKSKQGFCDCGKRKEKDDET